MTIYQVKIKTLEAGTEWRRLLIYNGITFEQLHEIIKVAFDDKVGGKDIKFASSPDDIEPFTISIGSDEEGKEEIKTYFNGYHPLMLYTDGATSYAVALERQIDDFTPGQLPCCIGAHGGEDRDIDSINKKLMRLVAGV